MDAIYFDLDGTLTDPKIGITRSIRYALQKLEHSAIPTEDELTWCIGPPLRASFAKLLGGEDSADLAVSYYRERFSDVGPGRVKTFFLPQKLHATGRDPRRRDRLSIFLLSSLESIRAQPRTTLSDPNGHTARTTIHTPHARIAARSGLIPRRFITRVRL